VELEEGEHLVPRVARRLGTVALGAREVQEGVARPGVGVELVRLAVAGQLGVDGGHVVARRVAVVGAEEADERAADALGELERRRAVAPGLHDVAAVEDAGRAPGRRAGAGQQIGDAASHAEAEDGEPVAARADEAPQVRDRSVGVGEDLVVAEAAHARQRGRAVVGLPVEQIGRRGGVAVTRQVVDLRLDESIEPRAMDGHQHTRARAAGRDADGHAHRVTAHVDGVLARHG
jgi:hypothetical protein